MMGMADACPMAVKGTAVQMANTSDGISMTFTTTTGDVTDLRSRVRAMADRMNARSSQGMGMGTGMHGAMMGGADAGPGMMMGHGMMMMPAVRAQVEDVEGGARLRVTPVDASKLADMREHMQRHVEMMTQQHTCPMPAEPRP
jgi:hypothetical protein